MKRLVTVTERHTYEVDVDELLVRLAHGLNGDGWHISDFTCAPGTSRHKVVLVEIDGGEAVEPFGSGDLTRERPGFDSQRGVTPSTHSKGTDA